MKNPIFKTIVPTLLGAFLLTSCMGPGVDVDRPGHTGGKVLGWNISTKNWLDAANDLSQQLVTSKDPRTGKPLLSEKPVIAISRIKAVNATARLNTDILVDNFLWSLRQSGKCIPTATFNLADLDNDPLIVELRKTRGSEEIDPATQVPLAKLEQPKYTITGSIHEETARRKGRFGRIHSEKVYTIRLSLNDRDSGTSPWQGQYFISKQGTGSARTW